MDMITVFKIVHGLEAVPFDNLFTFYNTITRGNGYKLFKHFCHLNVRNFAQRIIDDWNQLPTFPIESPDIMRFKTKLHIFWNAYRFHHS